MLYLFKLWYILHHVWRPCNYGTLQMSRTYVLYNFIIIFSSQFANDLRIIPNILFAVSAAAATCFQSLDFPVWWRPSLFLLSQLAGYCFPLFMLFFCCCIQSARLWIYLHWRSSAKYLPRFVEWRCHSTVPKFPDCHQFLYQFCIICKLQDWAGNVVVNIINIYNKIVDPMTDPCGTPLVTSLQS